MTKSIDHCLLGLIAQGECSGYDIRKILTGTPMRRFSDSPGSVYPALRRLELQGAIRSVPDAANRRGRTSYSLTRKGRALLTKWLRSPVTESDVAHQLDEVMLRLSFQHLLDPGHANLETFLGDLAKAASNHASKLRDYISTSTADYPVDALLALRAGLNMYVSITHWADEQRQQLSGRRSLHKRKKR